MKKNTYKRLRTSYAILAIMELVTMEHADAAAVIAEIVLHVTVNLGVRVILQIHMILVLNFK